MSFCQIDLFEDIPNYKITKPVRLIEFFAGVGFQRMGIEKVFPNLESWRICEWCIPSILAYDKVWSNSHDPIATDMSKDDLVKELLRLGVSVNYNDPATESELSRVSYEKLLDTYSAIQRTHNLVNIMNIDGGGLSIENTDKYEYIVTYSFPCQDLTISNSNAKGMEVSQADGGTRSGLVWEFLRLLKESKEKPQVLIMENVTQIHSYKNNYQFRKLQDELTALGYTSYWKDMLGSDYGIPQTRNRTFMVSILNSSCTYKFPDTVPLEKHLIDYLQPLDEVNIKTFVSEKMLNYLYGTNQKKSKYNRREVFERNFEKDGLASTICTTSGSRATDNYIIVPCATIKGFELAYEGDGVYINRVKDKRGTVQRGMIQTLKTQQDVGVVVCKDGQCCVRKLTALECIRLMGADDSVYHKLKDGGLSDSQIIHIAGDGLIVTIPQLICSQMKGD